MERAARPRHQFRDAVLGKAGLVVAAERRPVVGHLVIVPLREHRDFGVEGAEIVVEPVVFVVAAELREAVRGDGFFFRHDVAPDLAVRQLQLGRHRTIGIDVIAGMNEEVRTVVAAWSGRCAMPPRAGSMPQPWPTASPDQTNDTERRSAGAVRKCPTRVSPAIPLRDVVEANAVENVLPGRAGRRAALSR